MTNALLEFLKEHYIAMGLLALLGVYGMLAAHGVTGSRKLLKAATLQYVFIIIMVLTTPFLLYMLSSK